MSTCNFIFHRLSHFSKTLSSPPSPTASVCNSIRFPAPCRMPGAEKARRLTCSPWAGKPPDCFRNGYDAMPPFHFLISCIPDCQISVIILPMLRNGKYSPGRRYHDIEPWWPGINRFIRNLMSCLMESASLQKLDCFFQIIHIHADHRPFAVPLANVHMEAIGILHPNISNCPRPRTEFRWSCSIRQRIDSQASGIHDESS